MKKKFYINLTYKTKVDVITSFIGKLTMTVGLMFLILCLLGNIFSSSVIGQFADIIAERVRENIVGYCIIMAVLGYVIYYISYQHTLRLFHKENTVRHFHVYDLRKDFNFDRSKFGF